jgi:hypothetical protein
VGKVTQATRERVPFIIHKADQPDVVVNFFDTDGRAGKDGAEVNLFEARTDAFAVGDDEKRRKNLGTSTFFEEEAITRLRDDEESL